MYHCRGADFAAERATIARQNAESSFGPTADDSTTARTGRALKNGNISPAQGAEHREPSHMTKFEIIADIRLRNQTASEEFLAGFSEEDLLAYLSNLQEVMPVSLPPQQRQPQSRHTLGEAARPIHAPISRSYKPYMGRPTHAATTSCARRRRNYVQLG
jgi:hypothetical protein